MAIRPHPPCELPPSEIPRNLARQVLDSLTQLEIRIDTYPVLNAGLDRWATRHLHIPFKDWASEAKTAMARVMSNLRELCLVLDGKPVKLKRMVITIANLMDLRLRHDRRVKDPARSNRGFDLLGPFKGLRVGSVEIRVDFMDINPVAWNQETYMTYQYTQEVRLIMEGLGEKPEDPMLETIYELMFNCTAYIRNHKSVLRLYGNRSFKQLQEFWEASGMSGPCPAVIDLRRRLEVIKDDYSRWPFTEDPLGVQGVDEVVLAREGLCLRPNFGTLELDGGPALGHEWFMVKANRHMDYVPRKGRWRCKFSFACRDDCRTSLRVTTSVILLSTMVGVSVGIICDFRLFPAVRCRLLHWIGRLWLFALWILIWLVMARRGFW